MKKFFKEVKVLSLLDSLLAVVFGVLMICCTDFTKETIVYLFASLLLVIGVVKVINYFLYGLEPFGFIFGIADVAMSIVFFANAQSIVNSNIIGVVFGVVLIVKSLFEMQQSFDLRRMGSNYWWLDTIMAGCVLAFAISVVANPANEVVLFILLGAALIIDGIMGFVDTLVVSAKVKKTRKTLEDLFKIDDTTIEM